MSINSPLFDRRNSRPVADEDVFCYWGFGQERFCAQLEQSGQEALIAGHSNRSKNLSSSGLLAKWTRCRSPELEIPDSSPGRGISGIGFMTRPWSCLLNFESFLNLLLCILFHCVHSWCPWDLCALCAAHGRIGHSNESHESEHDDGR